MTGVASSTHRLIPAFRVGITGTRRIDPAALPVLQAQLAAILSHIRTYIAALARTMPVAGLYADGPVLLRFLSPLAEGADRLGAEAALAEGYQLEVPLPFAAADYEADFPDTVEAFRTLLAKAGPHVLELDGGRGDEESASYEAVGRYVIRNCDLLIAIWDGGKGNGRGGTADIVHYALRHSLPVWWLHAGAAEEPAWLEHHPRHVPPDRGSALAKLDDYLRQTIIPPATLDATDPLANYLAETPPPDRFIWSIYRRVMRLAAGRGTPHKAPPVPPQPASDAWAYWQAHYQPIDALAIAYGNRYRSSYILVFFLAALVVGFTAASIGIGSAALFITICELLGLASIFIIVHLNVRRHWHERLITYRLLAELCRKQQALTMFGWSLKIQATLPLRSEMDMAPATLPRDIWVAWYFNALARAAPLAQGSLSGSHLGNLFDIICANLITGQATYHANRTRDSENAAHHLGKLGRVFFYATVVMVLIKFGLELQTTYLNQPQKGEDTSALVTLLRFLLTVTPAISAALVGIRGYSELELLADQSAQMERLMQRTESKLRHLNLSVPLASQTIGAELLALTEAMMQDIKGWAQLFRIKAVEPG
ncbi:MAG: hypothetical protein B7Z75_12840 [Acidocella sp. 20-57-95]|nr:MAG: hypothetical protein B7Z75_12840 [Acidocella sp. 20-57-95]OYV60870.1 MAG: hypothetical protein B7Z71_05520 [Acidocella sp. 21-58-7]HQT63488.1 hypothetical protein [Acidocella sp.]HQU04492.1 hypothetical protein [Acidocella sp.]